MAPAFLGVQRSVLCPLRPTCPFLIFLRSGSRYTVIWQQLWSTPSAPAVGQEIKLDSFRATMKDCRGKWVGIRRRCRPRKRCALTASEKIRGTPTKLRRQLPKTQKQDKKKDVIVAHFNDIEPPPPAFSTSNVCGMFVTWDKHEQGVQNLRGCIGTLTPMSISSLKDYTYSSALNDRRFSPIEASELDALDVSVSLLLKYESARHWEDWEVGVHGIVINFNDDRGSSYSATFLPEVAAEQGWSRRVTLTRLVRKAGYKRTVDAAFLSRVQVTRYQSSKYKLSYQEYLDMRRLA
ncbi:unnamed protein product [Ascophyllum nodosum]